LVYRFQEARAKDFKLPVNEQRNYKWFLASFDESIDGYKRMRENYKLLGKRLAWDLLTGAKRFDGDP
jgi:hypothetical protein